MLPILAAVSVGAELVKLVPGLFKLFGDKPPPAIVDRVVEIAQAVTGAVTPEEALAKVQVDPEVLARYTEAAENRANDMIKAYLSDTQSARQRDTEIQKAKGRNVRAEFLTIAAISGVIICLAIAVWHTDLNEMAKASVSLILGRCLGWTEQIFSFEFGTTRQSKAKDETINQMASTSQITAEKAPE